jgi:hypothetical protein
MTILCTLLAAAVLALLGLGFWERRVHRAVVAELLDRIMARSYGEFVASRPTGPTRPLRRRVLSDEEMAELETNALAAKAAK